MGVRHKDRIYFEYCTTLLNKSIIWSFWITLQ
uniref:Uncharacterized protein n=1 Tax=Anguilla anguilla TaxID=7936 RepID=A0A0E9R984_ANGAN